MDRQAVDSINALQEKNRYLPGLRAWVGYKNAVIYYDRAAGDGKPSFISRIKYAMDAITSFSYKPLRLCFVLSGFASFLSIILASCSILPKSPIDIVGFVLAAAIFLVGGMLLLCIGVLGEYLGRVYDEVRGRPLSIINDVHYATERIEALTRTGYKEASLNLEYPETEGALEFKRVG